MNSKRRSAYGCRSLAILVEQFLDVPMSHTGSTNFVGPHCPHRPKVDTSARAVEAMRLQRLRSIDAPLALAGAGHLANSQA